MMDRIMDWCMRFKKPIRFDREFAYFPAIWRWRVVRTESDVILVPHYNPVDLIACNGGGDALD